MKVIDGVYAYVWWDQFENNCNTYFLGEPLNILVDPGLKNHVNSRLKDMENDGIDTEKIRYVLDTHCHPDHFEGTMPFIEKGIPVAMHREEIDFFNKMGPEFFSMFRMPFPEIEFDVVLEEGIWEVNGTELQVFQTPGHSPGSVCIYWKEKKTLVCGDLIFEKSFGRVDFPGGDEQKLVESIRRMSKLDVEILLPGHMNIITGADNVKRNFQILEQYFSTL